LNFFTISKRRLPSRTLLGTIIVHQMSRRAEKIFHCVLLLVDELFFIQKKIFDLSICFHFYLCVLFSKMDNTKMIINNK
ncbi:hypothetical protein T08_15967, partial [Trichinella sp. T8]